MACCKKNTGMGPSITDQLGDKLKQISDVYPFSAPACLLGRENGELISELPAAGHATEELGRNVASMRRAATQFARSLESSKQTDASNLRTLHVRGTDTIFSLYAFDQSVLAFYSKLSPSVAQSLDFNSKDKKLQPIIEDLKQLLRNLRTIDNSGQKRQKS